MTASGSNGVISTCRSLLLRRLTQAPIFDEEFFDTNADESRRGNRRG
ncbi:MAG: hypothetical protein ACLRSW_10480 [Christensenellaceae bacterium]